MHATNFTWSESIYVKTDQLELDLHNCYDFRQLLYDVSTRVVTMGWVRSTGEWVDSALPSRLELLMTGVHYLRVAPRDPEQPFTEDDCLASFGYESDEDWCDGQFWSDGPPDPSWRWSFLFQSGAELLVGGDGASMRLAS